MRILHLANHCRFGHGNVHAAVDLACEQAASGDIVAFGSSGGHFESLLNKNGVATINIEQDSRNISTIARGLVQLHRAIKSFSPDVVHAHMMTGCLIGYAATRFRGIALVSTVHNSFEKHAILMGLGDRVIGVSRSVTLEMERRGVRRSKLRTVINGTRNTARRAMLPEKMVSLPAPSLIYVGGLHPRKGIDDLLNAFAIASERHPGLYLAILGDGPHIDEYKALALKLRNGRNVVFYGQLEETTSYLRAADIFVLASLRDPCPLVLSEARECGCAIVATDVDGVPEMLAVGNAGILVPPKSPAAIATAINQLLDDPDLLLKQKQASQSGIEYFDIGRVCKETSAVYQSAL